MNNIKFILGSLCGICLLALTASCNRFLDRPPLTSLDNTPGFYNSETTLRQSVNGMLPIHFGGYQTGWSRSKFGNQTANASFSDDFGQGAASIMTKIAPATSGSWDFSRVKKMNILIEGVEHSTLDEPVKAHWKGVYLFYRALENIDLMQAFGDIPYYDFAVQSDDEKGLYLPRQNRTEVAKKILEDLKYAAANVRIKDGTPGVSLGRDAVCAKAAEAMLFEGSWHKYHLNDNANAKIFFEAARDFAKMIMDSGRYKISNDYHALFTSEDLAGNPEIIMYRSYEAGKVTHSVMSFDIEQPQGTAPSKSFVESYRTLNGLPIHQDGNAQYKGDMSFDDEKANRDPRMLQTLDSELHYEYLYNIYSKTGYFSRKFTNEDYIGKAQGQSSTNTTDAPVIRYAHVLLTYAEAVAELGTVGGPAMTQSDMNKSINLIRARKGVNMPPLTVSGDQVSVNGVVINDPDKDADVNSLLWEVRNERRVEMAFEGLRYDDLKRWNKLEKCDNQANPKQNMGAYVDLDALLDAINKIELKGKTDPAVIAKIKERNAGKVKNIKVYPVPAGAERTGYIKPTTDKYRVVERKHYLQPVPTGQITLYEGHNVVLTQNPGW